jgi:hypothetical protein
MSTRTTITILVAVVCLTFSFGTEAFAEGQPSAKATCQVADITLIQDTNQQDWTTILSNTIKTANSKDLFIDASLECGLYTQTLVRSKNGVKDTSIATATIKVRVLIDGVEAYPGEVVFGRRQQTLSATLEGMIAGCLTVGDNNNIILDENCVTPEEIELILETMDAAAFNFVMDDLSAGVHEIQVQAMIDTSTSSNTGTAQALATIGKGSVTIEEVRMIKNEDILLD